MRVMGILHNGSTATGFAELKERQTEAWQVQLDALKAAAAELIEWRHEARQWGVLLEYPIPRRQKRVDAVLLAGDIILCLEFKTGEQVHQRSTARQVEDYALDLRDFHAQSNGRVIVPIAMTVRAKSVDLELDLTDEDEVKHVVQACGIDLQHKIKQVVDRYSLSIEQIDVQKWNDSAYHPVPTIIEAAEALYAGHDVREIARSHAGAENLGKTSNRLIELAKAAQETGAKAICFVTGVPGAGKTLAGLNVAHNPEIRVRTNGMGVFLSGNGPLVKIVSAAIARDSKRRLRRDDAKRTVSTFIQNVHTFIKDSLNRTEPPVDHLIIFDEAQRAWDAVQCEKKINQSVSEPQLILSIMGRHKDWAMIIALVGNGQEINTGEAGLAEWGRAIMESKEKWQVYAAPSMFGGDRADGMQQLFNDGIPNDVELNSEPSLHLNVSLRSYKAEAVSRWVDAVIEGDSDSAKEIIRECEGFPLVLTRHKQKAMEWLRANTRGNRRCGLLASSGALRLRAEGIELSSGFRRGDKDLYVNWFLNDLDDIRASNQLEVAATEYECQGLEVDLSCLCWGGDLTRDTSDGWSTRKFSGNKWKSVNDRRNRRYLLNSYRVLMTRAREGMVIWVPQGLSDDNTRCPGGYDRTAAYLLACGIRQLD